MRWAPDNWMALVFCEWCGVNTAALLVQSEDVRAEWPVCASCARLGRRPTRLECIARSAERFQGTATLRG